MLQGLKRVASRLVGKAGLPRDMSGDDRALMSRIREERLTYLSEKKLACLVRTARAIEAARLPGAFLEAGCALGGSAILLARVKKADRPLEVYDVFGMIPPPTKEDTPDVHERYRTIVQGQSQGIGGDPYYGYRHDLYEVVQGNFRRFGIELCSSSMPKRRKLPCTTS